MQRYYLVQTATGTVNEAASYEHGDGCCRNRFDRRQMKTGKAGGQAAVAFLAR